MAYYLLAGEPLSNGLLRIFREEIDLSIAALSDPKPSNRDKHIHEARKCIKKLRAILRLALPTPGSAFRRDRALLRDTGRELSGFRDAAALLETVDALLEKNPGDPALVLARQGLCKQRKADTSQDDPKPAIARVVLALTRLRGEPDSWPAIADDFSAIAAALKRTYRDGRRALARVRARPTPKNFHELRKNVKDHWYHTRLLTDLWAGPFEAREKCLRELQEWLGDDHNLAVLTERMPDLGAIASQRQNELRVAALRMAERLYVDRPRDHERLIGRLWRLRPMP